MATGKRRLTFISYSRADKDFALGLAKELKESGFNVWLDQLDIPTGARWDDEVEKALVNCEIFMIILTPDSIASNNVKDEIGYAIDTNKRILPILLENADVPFRLRRFQYVDFRNKSTNEGIELAKQLLQKLVDEPTGPNAAVSPDVERLAHQRVAAIQRAREQEQLQRSAQAVSQYPAYQPQAPQGRAPTQTTSRLIYFIIGIPILLLLCLGGGWLVLPFLLPPATPADTPIPTSVPSIAPSTIPSSTFIPVVPTATESPAPAATFTFTAFPSITPRAQADPQQFVINYFNTVIRDKDITGGWSLLTAEYQVEKADGWDTYSTFWRSVDRWEYSAIQVEYNSPPRALVRITYKLYYLNTNTRPSVLDGVAYCLLQSDNLETWKIDLRDNCP